MRINSTGDVLGEQEMLWPTGWKIPKSGILGTDPRTAEKRKKRAKKRKKSVYNRRIGDVRRIEMSWSLYTRTERTGYQVVYSATSWPMLADG